MLPRGLLQEYSSALTLLSRVLDVAVIFLGALLAHFWRFGNINLSQSYQIAILLGLLIVFIVFSASGIYSSWRGKSWLHQARVVTLTWFTVVFILILLCFKRYRY